ncbi:transporter substrate-binding domain-containing protein [Pseudodesulfovibrio cashew]|uniref:Transporter substrate-binding domain-containing protein n=1 Tax=Pseudodesulfovibrio cashew TaxID=2678688 RepID=A0A6I6JIR6_9BACT|nr:transporter substrate-binding domain-containing protein [Pseudodesulfovibrio cashew]QGY40067.1 transporter substrate-binding domain-containing protein [Pseudodesulfovibrio cashew]
MIRKLLTLFLCLALLGTTQTTWAADKVSLSIGEWPPYFSEEFPHFGFGPRVCTEAFRKVGITPSYFFLPWKRSFEGALHGRYTGSLAWRKNPEREKLFFFSDPVFNENTIFFYRHGIDFHWDTLEDVGHWAIGATLGYAQGKDLEPLVRAECGSLEYAPSDEANLRKLARGRIDIFPCSENVGRYLLLMHFKPEERAKIKWDPKPLYSGALHLIISREMPNGKELIERFNKGLRMMHEDGTYARFEKELLNGDDLPALYRPQQGD